MGNTDTVILSDSIGEVADYDDIVLSRIGLSDERDDIAHIVELIYPFESFGFTIVSVQCGLCTIESVYLLHHLLQAFMPGIFEDIPVQTPFVVPFAPLPYLSSHEEKFLARMGYHICQQRSQIGQLLIFVTGHFVQERALHMHHFVMTQRQKIVFVVHIDETEGKMVMMMLSIDGVVFEIFQSVVHPAHIPFVSETESTYIGGTTDHRKGGGLFRHHHDTSVFTIDRLVELSEKLYRFYILVASVTVGNPLTLFSRIVEIEHGCHRIDSDSVYMVSIQPKHGAAYQKSSHLVSTVVEDGAPPLRMKSLPRVFVFVECRPVELIEPVPVGNEMRRHPVHYHTYTVGVHDIYERHEFVRSAVAGGGCEISGGLITPRTVERILRNRHYLYMRIVHLHEIFGQFTGQFTIVRDSALFSASFPRAQMHFVDVDRIFVRTVQMPVFHPLFITPSVTIEAKYPGGRLRSPFGIEGIGIALVSHRRIW